MSLWLKGVVELCDNSSQSQALLVSCQPHVVFYLHIFNLASNKRDVTWSGWEGLLGGPSFELFRAFSFVLN